MLLPPCTSSDAKLAVISVGDMSLLDVFNEASIQSLSLSPKGCLGTGFALIPDHVGNCCSKARSPGRSTLTVMNSGFHSLNYIHPWSPTLH